MNIIKLKSKGSVSDKFYSEGQFFKTSEGQLVLLAQVGEFKCCLIVIYKDRANRALEPVEVSCSMHITLSELKRMKVGKELIPIDVEITEL